MEREIIKSLRRKPRQELLDTMMLTEARRTPLDLFLDQLAGTLNRLETINQRYNSEDQQKIISEYIIDHLRFLQLNRDVIRRIIETPNGTPTGIVMNDFVFESVDPGGKEVRLQEATSPMEMFFKEFDELYNRASFLVSKYTDTERAKEFESIVMARLKYIRSAENRILQILQAHPDEDLSRILKSLKGKLKYAKAQVVRSRITGDDLPDLG